MSLRASTTTMKKAFILKDSPPEIIESAKVEPQGRTYTKEYSERPGGIRIDEVLNGMKFASLAITDDKPNTLRKVGRTNPWQVEALRIITGSKEEAHKSLSEILHKQFSLNLDHMIDVSGCSTACHVLDTQGYIAHNDEIIVLAYRCTTSGFDWLTNLTTTTSAWELDEDIAQGHSGYISCVAGSSCCVPEQDYLPRVHTGFYNNFLVTAPLIQEFIEPLLGPDQPPRKLYVVGHSLGAGIATLAGCYFLTRFDWTKLAQRLIVVTAGSPRAVQQPMKDLIDEKMNIYRPLDKAVICRVVRDKDVVSTVPPSIFGFRHLDKLVYITKDDEVLINPNLGSKQTLDRTEMAALVSHNMHLTQATSDDTQNGDGGGGGDEDESAHKAKYERKIALVPRSLKDHMPDFYLKPLIALSERESGANANDDMIQNYDDGIVDHSDKVAPESAPENSNNLVQLPVSEEMEENGIDISLQQHMENTGTWN